MREKAALGIYGLLVPGVALYVCVPEVCRMREARYSNTASAGLTADQSAVLSDPHKINLVPMRTLATPVHRPWPESVERQEGKSI